MDSQPQNSEEHQEGISRRSVLKGAVAIGGALAVAGALGGTAIAQNGAAQAPAASAADAARAKTANAAVAAKAKAAPAARAANVDAPGSAPLPGWKIQPFQLDQVTLNPGGVFDRAKDGLLAMARNYSVDTILTCFRAQAGIETTASPAGGWENFPSNSIDRAHEQQWGPSEYKRGQNKNGADGLLRGHYAGHMLSMFAQAYAESHDAVILDKINQMIDGLEECRAKMAAMKTADGQPRYSHEGFLAAYGEWQFSALEAYAPYGEIWAPWYTEHKILAGLIACYELAGNATALKLAEGIGRWAYGRLSKCTHEQLQKMWGIYIGGEYGGMNDALIDLYNASSAADKDKFLKASHFFDTDKLINNCANNVDILNGMHANQHLPQFVGYAKDAALSDADVSAEDKAKYQKVVDNFWGMIVPGRMYSHGGTGEGELWGPAHTVAGDIGKRNCESCAAYNMLKIARSMFFIEGKPAYMDYYERTVLNHILGGKSRNIDSGTALSPGNCYMYPVHPAAIKEYGDGNIGTCCGGTALESHTKYQDSIYFHSADNKELYVNLYMPSTVDWADAGVKVTQTTAYPEEGTSTLKVETAPAGGITVRVRIPAWSKGATVTLNGKTVDGVKAGAYAAVEGAKQGDTIVVTIPLQLRIESTDDRKDIQTLFYGPTALNALSKSTKFIPRGFYERYGLDGTIKLGIEKKAGTKNYFIIDGDEFEPAYNGDNTPYHMYFQRKDAYVGFAGKLTGVANAAKDDGTTLMDDIWSAAPFKDRMAFVKQVQTVTKQYLDDGLITSRARQTVLLAAGRAKMS